MLATGRLIAAGSGVLGALRHSINQAWDIEARPPLLFRKALDVTLGLGATVVLLLSAVKFALELYFESLSDFGALYGSLGALMALLVFVYAAANVLVFGAEFASEWARLPEDEEVHRILARARRRVRA